MLTFKKLKKENIQELLPYFAAQRTHLSDFSAGFQYMWNKQLSPDYAFADGALILRELYVGKYYFHYPLSPTGDEAQEKAALAEIERYCRDNDLRLHFTNVPRGRLGALALRYGAEVHISDPRRWRDYLYRAEDFRSYPGGKYSGQRNHVNKFKKNYPDHEFREYREEDEEELLAFLGEYERVQRSKNSYLAQEEMTEVYELLPQIRAFGLRCGLLLVGGKIVGVSAGERCGDMMVVHVEKALREYEGAYPYLAQRFAQAFCGEGVDYLNRMDDAGDGGLRKSKLQYLPCEIVDKYNVVPHRAIDGVSRLPEIVTERLTLRAVADEDGEEYRRLAADTVRNRWWGYDYRVDFEGGGLPSAEWFLAAAREDFHRKNEMPVGIYCGGELIGEVVLHRFGYASEAEVGARLLPEYEGRGYASEAVRAMTEYAFLKLGLDRVEAKCNRENERSAKMLVSAGMRRCGEDDTYYYFYKTPAT